VLVTVYPRRMLNGQPDNFHELRDQNPDEYANLLAHCVRIAAELGADVVKTAFPGTANGMTTVVEAAMGVPVVIAGGTPLPRAQAIENARVAVHSGAAGVAYGRQIFLDPNPAEIGAKIRIEIEKALDVRSA